MLENVPASQGIEYALEGAAIEAGTVSLGNSIAEGYVEGHTHLRSHSHLFGIFSRSKHRLLGEEGGLTDLAVRFSISRHHDRLQGSQTVQT